ncbi:cyclopropane-fatty-acyl-phospholipid synthase family protein [Streptomyces sp. NPDC094143]|uniref:cyclopropane-fatty-acyl-phospholipid synthase family protein n=1 Tax=Streptomyces sp. NPDC094143 TaxID=3155310 RepID=UPI00332CAC09
MTTVAPRLADLLRLYALGALPVQLRAWDGSEAGPDEAPLVIMRSPTALRRLLWQPGELGLAEAYIADELDIEGNLAEGLSSVWRSVAAHGVARPRATELARAAVTALRLGAAGPRPSVPGAPRARLRGSLHSAARDRAAVSHHYDLSNDFYALLLDESMAYSCGYWTQEEARGYRLADAQRDKLALICRKLGLRPGMRLLDIGCGWGSLSLYAAREHGVRVTAVAPSRQQHGFVAARAQKENLADAVDVQLRHYRDIDEGGYDAVAAIEMGEHVGDTEYPAFAALLHHVLWPRGRALVQQMSRGANAPGGGAFIETYIPPDMHMRPLGATVGLLEEAGLEVRDVQALREHYASTLGAWHRTLDSRWEDVVALVGEPTARVWRLYLAGSGLAFAERRMGVDQILAVRLTPEGESGMPAVLRRSDGDGGGR